MQYILNEDEFKRLGASEVQKQVEDAKMSLVEAVGKWCDRYGARLSMHPDALNELRLAIAESARIKHIDPK